MNKPAVKQPSNSRKSPGRPFKKGQSGNPNGRPKTQFTIADILRKISAEKSAENEKKTNLEMICSKAIEQAIEGNKDARNWIADRSEGRAIARVLEISARGEWDGEQDPMEYLNERLVK